MSKRPQKERRRAARFRPDPEAGCEAVVAAWDGELPAKLHNVSTGGVGLVLGKRLEPGMLVAVRISNRSGLFVRTLPLLVVHVNEVENSQFYVGGAFGPERLTIDDVRALLT